jgi:hypothetical protein
MGLRINTAERIFHASYLDGEGDPCQVVLGDVHPLVWATYAWTDTGSFPRTLVIGSFAEVEPSDLHAARVVASLASGAGRMRTATLGTLVKRVEERLKVVADRNVVGHLETAKGELEAYARLSTRR